MQRKSLPDPTSADFRVTSLTHFRHAVRRVANTLNPSVVVQSTEVDDVGTGGKCDVSAQQPSGPHRTESSTKRKLHKISLLSRFRSRTQDANAAAVDDILAAAAAAAANKGGNCHPQDGHERSNGEQHPAPGSATDDVIAPAINQFGPCCCGPGSAAHNGAAAPPADDGHAHGPEMDGVRVYKKTSTNGKLTLYVINRDLVISKDNISPLHGVVTVDREEIANKKIFAQILLTFRYGRDDEEVMGLKLSNESVLCVEQVYPPPSTPDQPPSAPSQCQEILLRRLGSDSHLVTLRLTSVAPPSVRLLPAKEYRGAAIGISYDLRVYTVENVDERPQRRNQVRMALRLVQYAPLELQRASAPRLTLEKHFLLREGTVRLDVALDRKWYQHGTPLNVSINVHNGSSRIVRKIRITTIQHVDVSMFSNGKFKNVVATSEDSDGLPLTGGNSLQRQYRVSLENENGSARHWVALEDRYGRFTNTLASTTLKSSPTERNFFAIYVTYYVKVRLIINGVGGDVSVKVPFSLMRDGPEPGDEVEQPATTKPAIEQSVDATKEPVENSETSDPSEPAEPVEPAENSDNFEPNDTTDPSQEPRELQNPFADSNGSPDSSECSSPIDPIMEQQPEIEAKTNHINNCKDVKEDLP